MGYFDSAKNRAAWERKMAVLREERKRREAEGFKPGAGQEETKKQDILKPGVTRMTFRELEAEEAAQHAKSASRKAPVRETNLESQKEKTDTMQQLKPRERSM